MSHVTFSRPQKKVYLHAYKVEHFCVKEKITSSVIRWEQGNLSLIIDPLPLKSATWHKISLRAQHLVNCYQIWTEKSSWTDLSFESIKSSPYINSCYCSVNTERSWSEIFPCRHHSRLINCLLYGFLLCFCDHVMQLSMLTPICFSLGLDNSETGYNLLMELKCTHQMPNFS